MASSTIFRERFPASKDAGGISTGLNSPSPEGALSSLLSHLILRFEGMHGAIAIRPLSLLSPSEQQYHQFVIQIGSLSSPTLRKGNSRSQLLNSQRIRISLGDEFRHTTFRWSLHCKIMRSCIWYHLYLMDRWMVLTPEFSHRYWA